MFPTECTHCGASVQIPLPYHGKTVHCPVCKLDFCALRAEERPFSFNCPSCGGSIEAEPDWVGIAAPCPHCQQAVRIPNRHSPHQSVAPASPPPVTSTASPTSPTEQSPTSTSPTAVFVAVLLAIFVGGGLFLAVSHSNKPQTITGYETKVLFVGESDYSAESDFRKATQSGWEIKSSRRAWTNHEYRYGEKQWGTEYTLQKPIYGDRK